MRAARPLWEGIGWILTLVGTILTLLAGDSNELRLTALASLVAGLILLLTSVPRRHFTTTHRYLVAFCGLQFAVTSGFSLIPGAAPVVLNYYGWIWFAFLCLQSVLTLMLLVFTRYAVAKLDFEDINQRLPQRLSIGLTALSAVTFCAGLILVVLVRNAPENLLAVVWLTLVWLQGILIILRPTGERVGWILTLVGTILTLLAGSSSELRLLTVIGLATGLILLRTSVPRRHFTTTHRYLVAFCGLQFGVTVGFSLIPGAAPVVLNYYGWIWFAFLCVQSLLTLTLLVFTRYAIAKVDFEDINQRLLERLSIGLTAFSAVTFCAGLILVVLVRNAPENLLAVVWLTLVWLQGIAIILRPTGERVGWILTLVGTILTLLAGSSSELRLLTVVSLATGLILLLTSVPRRHFTTTHRYLVAFCGLQFAVTSGFSLIPGTAPVVLNYYGWIWFAFLCVQSLLTLTLLVFTRYAVAKLDFEDINQRLLQRMSIGLTAFSVVTFCAGLVLVVLVRNAPENLLAVVWLTLVWPQGIAIILGKGMNWVPNVHPRLLYVGCGLFVAAGIILNLASVHSFPFFLNTDEPWTVNFSDTLHNSGHLYASFYPDGNVPSLSAPRLYYLTDAWMDLWQRDLFSARTFSLVPGLLLIPVTFGLARLLISPSSALIAAALLSTSIMWLGTSHIARPEMWLALAVWLGFLLVTMARRRQSSILAFLAGLLIALSAEIHLYGILFCFIFGLWWLLDWRAVRREKTLIGAFVLGGLIGGVTFVSYHLLPDPEPFLNDVMKETHASLTAWQAMTTRLHLYVTASPLEAGLLGLGSAAAFIVNRQMRGLAVFLGITLLTYALVISDPNMYYTMLYIPGLVILVTSMLRYLSSPLKVFFATAAVGVFLLNTLVIASYVNDNWNQRVLEAFDQVAAQVPATGTVVARPMFYLAFREPRFVAFTYVESLITEPTPAQYWQGILDVDPEYLITSPPDWGIETISQPLSYNHYMELPVAPETLMLAYEVLEQVDTPLGTFQIWQKR